MQVGVDGALAGDASFDLSGLPQAISTFNVQYCRQAFLLHKERVVSFAFSYVQHTSPI